MKPAAFQSHVNSGTQSRLEPSRAWFSNTKVNSIRLSIFAQRDARGINIEIIVYGDL